MTSTNGGSHKYLGHQKSGRSSILEALFQSFDGTWNGGVLEGVQGTKGTAVQLGTGNVGVQVNESVQ